MLLHFRKLESTDDTSSFDCGVDALNTFIKERACREMSQRLSTTIVALSESGDLAGFYSLSPAEIAREDLSKKDSRGVPYPSIPCIRIGRLAVDKSLQGQGLGKKVLRGALIKCLKISNELGGRFILIDAKGPDQATFYEKYGFKSLSVRPLTLVIKTSTISKGIDDSDDIKRGEDDQ